MYKLHKTTLLNFPQNSGEIQTVRKKQEINESDISQLRNTFKSLHFKQGTCFQNSSKFLCYF